MSCDWRMVCLAVFTDLPAFVMIISVPASWNFFHSSLSWRTTLMFSMFWKRAATQTALSALAVRNKVKLHVISNINLLLSKIICCWNLEKNPLSFILTQKSSVCEQGGYLVVLAGAGNVGSCGQAQSWLVWKEIPLGAGLDPAHTSIRHSWNLLLQHLCRIGKIPSCQAYRREMSVTLAQTQSTPSHANNISPSITRHWPVFFSLPSNTQPMGCCAAKWCMNLNSHY